MKTSLLAITILFIFLTVSSVFALKKVEMPAEMQTKIETPIERAIQLKLPLQQPDFHWTFMSKEDFLAGSLILNITRGEDTHTITIFENGKISEDWEEMALPTYPKTGEIYFGFTSTKKYLTAPNDQLELILDVKQDLEGIGGLYTGILKTGTYQTKGTYSGLIDEFKIAQAGKLSDEAMQKAKSMYDYKAFLENWETQWDLQITKEEGWLPPEKRKSMLKMRDEIKNN